MATADRELSIVIKAVIDGLLGPVKQAETAVGNFATNAVGALDKVEERSENLRHVWKSLFEAFIGVEIVDVLKKIAEGADEAAQRLEIASNSARNFGHSLDANEMESWLQRLSAAPQGGGYGLPDMRQGVQEFAGIGLDSNQIKRATEDTANLAATFGFSFPEAVTIARDALTGHVDMLTRYGIISREAAKNIHTVEQAMNALENASKGGAEKRADGLAGAFGRLSNAVSNLSDAFGGALIPYFTATANALTNMANAFTALPGWVQNAAAGIAFFTTALAGVGLMLPAVKLGIEFVGNALAILGAPVKLAVSAFNLFGSLLGGPLVEAAGAASKAFIALAADGVEILSKSFLGLGLLTLRGVVMSALSAVGEALATVGASLMALLAPIGAVIAGWAAEAAAAISAWMATIAPIAAVIAAIALIGLAIFEIVKHWDGFKAAAQTALKWVGDRIHDFVEFVKQQFQAVGEILHGVWDFLTGNKANGLAELKSGLGNVAAGWKGVGMAAFEAGKKGVAAVNGWLQSQGWFRAAEKMISGFFSAPTTKAPGFKPEDFSGTIPGKGAKNTAGQAAQNAFKNLEEETKGWLQAFADRVDEARHILEKSKAALDNFKATLPNEKPQTQQQATEEARLITNEIRAQQELHTRLVAQHNAEVHAAQQYLSVARSVSPELKNHDQLVRSALDAARQHHKAAESIAEEYLRIAGVIAGLVKDHHQVYIDVHEHIITTRDQNAQTAADNGQRAFDTRQNAREDQIAAIQGREAIAQAKGSLTPTEAAAYKVQLAQIAAATAQDRDALAQHIKAVYDEIAARKDATQEERNRAKDADNAAVTAHRDYIKSVNDLNVATIEYDKTLKNHTMTFGQALDDLVKKLNIPGLSQNANGVFSFSPMAFLLQAFEQTKAFGDIMQTVNQIVKVFAQVLDALRPVIDVVLTVVRAVANVFIFLYDTVARILRLLGIHLQLIQSLNAAYGNIPLIQITHNIPTLNELAAGHLNSPLSNQPTGYNSLQSIGNTHTTLLQTIVGILGAILAAEMLAKHGGILDKLGGMFGGILGHGGGNAMSGYDSAANSIFAQFNNPQNMTQAVSNGILADGTSSSGGLFTSMNNAMQSAAPYIGTAIAGVLGSAIGGGGAMSGILSGVGGIVGTIFGGPVGGMIGSFAGGIIGGLFGHHKSAPPPTTQTTTFTAMLHAGTDIHAWMNQLAAPLASTLRSMQSASTALAGTMQNLAAVSRSMNVQAEYNFNHTTSIGNVHLNNDLDVENLGRKLGDSFMRNIRTSNFSIARANLG